MFTQLEIIMYLVIKKAFQSFQNRIVNYEFQETEQLNI